MAWKDLKADHVRCPHCGEKIELKVESRVKVSVREPFRLSEGTPTKGE